MYALTKTVQHIVDEETRGMLAELIVEQTRYSAGWLNFIEALADEVGKPWGAADPKERKRLHQRGLAIGRARQLIGAVLVNVMRDVGANVGEIIQQEFPGPIGKHLAERLREADVRQCSEGLTVYVQKDSRGTAQHRPTQKSALKRGQQ